MFVAIFAIFLTILIGLYVYTTWHVRNAEQKYPAIGRFLTVEGVRIHYVSKGSGKPVVLLHGSDGFLQDYSMTMLDRVAEQYQAIAFDRPGHGYSDLPKHENATPMMQARMLHVALRELGINKPMLVGHSWSGALVLAYALQYPNDVAGIVFLAGIAYGSDGSVPLLFKLPLIPGLGNLITHTLWIPIGHNIVKQTLIRSYYPDPLSPDYLKAAQALWLRPRQAKAWVRENISVGHSMKEMSARYSEIRVPVIIVTGDSDLDVSPEWHAYPLHKSIAHSKLMVLPKTGHEIPHTRPEAVLLAIDEAWADVLASG